MGMDAVVFCRVAITATSIFIICSGVFFIHPINKYKTNIENGTCRVSTLSWVKVWCDENRSEYWIPFISARYRNITSTGYQESIYKGLFINEHRADIDETKYKATLFDDGSDDSLIQCEWSNVQLTMNELLAEHIPSLTVNGSGFDETSISPSYLTNTSVTEWFPCYHDKSQDVLYIDYTEPNVLLSIIFAVAALLHIIVSFVVVSKDDNDDAVWLQVATLTVMGVYVIHMALYMIIYLPFLLFGKELMDPDELFKKGSIFFPIFWLVKKIRDCSCRSRSTTPPPQRRNSIQITTVVTPPPVRRTPPIRRTSTDPTVSIASSSGTIGPNGPNYDIHSIEPTAPPVLTSTGQGPPTYHDLVIDNEASLPPPPSYDEVVGDR